MHPITIHSLTPIQRRRLEKHGQAGNKVERVLVALTFPQHEQNQLVTVNGTKLTLNRIQTGEQAAGPRLKFDQSRKSNAMDNCVFCDIVDRRAPADIITENEDVIVFLSLVRNPLVVPKKHIPDIYSLEYELGEKIMRESIRLARAVKCGLNCDGIHVIQANGSAAGQDVFHYHMHIHPRWHDTSHWESGGSNGEQVAERIRTALLQV